MNELILEYKQSLKQVRQAIRKIERKDAPTEEDQVQVSVLRGMERDLLWSIEWMKIGKEPENRRGVERLAGYQREYPIDPFILDVQGYTSFYQWFSNRLTKGQMVKLEQMFLKLSRNERDVYIMSRGRGLTYQEIALMLRVKKGTVQKLMERAEKKIKDNRRTIQS